MAEKNRLDIAPVLNNAMPVDGLQRKDLSFN